MPGCSRGGDAPAETLGPRSGRTPGSPTCRPRRRDAASRGTSGRAVRDPRGCISAVGTGFRACPEPDVGVWQPRARLHGIGSGPSSKVRVGQILRMLLNRHAAGPVPGGSRIVTQDRHRSSQPITNRHPRPPPLIPADHESSPKTATAHPSRHGTLTGTRRRVSARDGSQAAGAMAARARDDSPRTPKTETPPSGWCDNSSASAALDWVLRNSPAHGSDRGAVTIHEQR
jgi:hypothetical protein